MKLRQTIIFLICLLSFKNLLGQSAISIEAHTIGMHFFGNPNLRYYENNFDSLGYFCAEPGAMFSYEFYVSANWLSIQLSQSFFSDAAGLLAGFTKISLRYMFFHKFRNQLYIDVAPAITYRKSWTTLGPYYIREANYKRNGNIEFRPSIITKIEYDIFIRNRSDVNISIMYGNSYKTLSFMLGYRYWINYKVKTTQSCDCYNFKKKTIWRRLLQLFR